MSDLPILNALDFKTPMDLAIALLTRKDDMPCVIKIGKEAWTVQDYEHGQRLAHGIMLATAPEWEGK